MDGVALGIAVGEHLEDHGTFLGRWAEEVVAGGKIFIFVGSTHVLKSQILGIMLDQFGGLVAEVACSCHEPVPCLSEPGCRVVRVVELGAPAVVDEHDTHILAHMAVAQHIQIIEKCQVTHNGKTQLVRVNQRCSDER